MKNIGELLRECLDEELVSECNDEIDNLASAIEYHVDHTMAQNETMANCEKQKRLDIERQLKHALHILDTVRGEIEDTKQKHMKVVERLRGQRSQLKTDKVRLSTELANITNEVARLTVVQQQVGTVEDRIERVGRNCQHSKHTDHSKLRFVDKGDVGQSGRGELEQELSVSRAVVMQQQCNLETLRNNIKLRGNNNSIHCDSLENINKKGKNQGIKWAEPSTKPTNDSNNNKLNKEMMKVISSSVHEAIDKQSKNVQNSEALQKRVAALLLQSEQKSISELNSRMNKHIETLTCLLQNLPRPGTNKAP
ncbi:protein bicaudal D homolog 1-like [Symsagittifera roscoffensis]|uniref:protein bicaudal D homolog 1-like n=1 Tax=Symsagittifera roscoffensis TaxID=84072 RepID=UPI00307C1F0E